MIVKINCDNFKYNKHYVEWFYNFDFKSFQMSWEEMILILNNFLEEDFDLKSNIILPKADYTDFKTKL